MRIKRGLTHDIVVRLPGWQSCVVEVQDIGVWTFWGVLRDIKTNQIISCNYIGRINDDWQPVYEAETLLQKIKVKKSGIV